jgi:hypothetical protein
MMLQTRPRQDRAGGVLGASGTTPLPGWKRYSPICVAMDLASRPLAVAAAQSLGDRVCEGWFEFHRGWFHLQMHLWDDAREPLQHALTIAKELHDDLMCAWTLTTP